MKRWMVRALVLVLLLDATGCSWLRHRREARAARAQAVVAATPAPVAPAPPADATPETPAAVEGLGATDAAAARGLAADFYEMHARFAGRGLPDATAMKAYGAFLCPSLVRAIEDARARQQAFAAAHPGDKPPLAEGDLFSSLFEGVERARALQPARAGESVRVPVALSRGPGPGAQAWEDALLLQRDDGVWCVADVEYGGRWPAANTGRLTDTLKSAFE
jgi:hypothetical protein